MKKYFFLFFMIASVVAIAQERTLLLSSQTQTINVVGFAGQWWLFKNLKNQGFWGGVYIDGTLFQSKYSSVFNNKWSLGIYAAAAKAGFESNLTRYKARTEEYSSGLILGYYEDLSPKKALFLGTGLGVKFSSDIGASKTKLGVYRGAQEDWLLSLSLNINILKKKEPGLNPWHRSQLQISLDRPLRTSRLTSWDGKAYLSDRWDRGYLDALFKQSVVDIFYSKSFILTPKMIAGYSYSFGDKKSYFGIGTELSLHKLLEDDYLSIFWIFKGNNKFDHNLSVAGLNVNFPLLF